MIPSNFDYVAPTTVDDAVAALSQAGEDAKVIAGGQSLMPVLRLRLAAPTTLVDLGRIDELRGVREDGVPLRTRRSGIVGRWAVRFLTRIPRATCVRRCSRWTPR